MRKVFVFLLTAAIYGCSSDGIEPVQTFYTDGTLHKQYSIRIANGIDTVRHGAYKSYYPSGRLRQEGIFVHGEKDSVWSTWYDSDEGVRISEGAYSNGLIDGQWKFWMDPSHSHHQQMQMASRQHDGYDHSDTMQPMMHGGADSMDHSGHKTADEMSPVKIVEYEHGKRNGLSISWHPNGGVADSMYYVNDQIVGWSLVYHENGQLATKVEYINGEKTGVQTYWDENGAELRTITHALDEDAPMEVP